MDDRESRLFWGALYITPAVWVLLSIGCVLQFSFKWLMVCMMALIMTSTNLVGYHKCQKGQDPAPPTLALCVRVCRRALGRDRAVVSSTWWPSLLMLMHCIVGFVDSVRFLHFLQTPTRSSNRRRKTLSLTRPRRSCATAAKHETAAVNSAGSGAARKLRGGGGMDSGARRVHNAYTSPVC